MVSPRTAALVAAAADKSRPRLVDPCASRSQSELLPEKAFFGKEKLMEFIKGKKYKKLMTDMKKGMRT